MYLLNMSSPFELGVVFISVWAWVQSCSIDIIAHLPRTMFSDTDIEVLLWLLAVNGVKPVPSLRQVKASATLMQSLCGVSVKEYVGKHGHTYYVNSLESIIQLVRFTIWIVRKCGYLTSNDLCRKCLTHSFARTSISILRIRGLISKRRVRLIDGFMKCILPYSPLCIDTLVKTSMSMNQR